MKSPLKSAYTNVRSESIAFHSALKDALPWDVIDIPGLEVCPIVLLNLRGGFVELFRADLPSPVRLNGLFNLTVGT